jgi:hypothetical protein
MGKPCLLDQVRGNAAVHDAEHLPHDHRLAGEQETQGIRKAQHPLTYRLFGKDLIDQQRGTLRHAPRPAPQLGQKPLRLQLKATKCSAWQVSQRTRRQICREHI